jgi:hypothetical protein
LHQWLAAGDDADSIQKKLQELGIRYLVITPGYGGGTTVSLIAVGETPQQQRTMAELRSRLAFIGTRDHVDVYRVPDR